MFTDLEDLMLGCKYRDMVTGVTGIAIELTSCLTGAPRIKLKTTGDKAMYYSVDITRVEFVDYGVLTHYH